MGLFSKQSNQTVNQSQLPRHSTDGYRNDAFRNSDHAHNHKQKKQRQLYAPETGHLNTRPSFGQWLKMTWLDILTMILMGAVGLGIYMADPAPRRSFPVFFNSGDIVLPEMSYPLRKNIIPIWAAALIAFFVPFTVFIIVQIRVRSFWDFNNAVVGLLNSLITAAVFQVFVKWLIGGLRPHFLAVCQPNVPTSGLQLGTGFQNIMYDRSVCTGDPKEINDSLESMPSGHSTAAFAGFIFLYCYLNGKLKVFANYHVALWKLIILYAPVLGACLIAGSLTIDEFHHWYDVLAGAIIGTVVAFSSYRCVYASVWDFRYNHVPLSRHVPFTYGHGSAGGFGSSVFTHSAGWGAEEVTGGAPFDAGHGSGGGFAAHLVRTVTGRRHSNGYSNGYSNGNHLAHQHGQHHGYTQQSQGNGNGNGYGIGYGDRHVEHDYQMTNQGRNSDHHTRRSSAGSGLVRKPVSGSHNVI